MSNNEFESEDYDWCEFRKDFDYENLNSDAIKEFIAEKKVKKFKMPHTPAAKSKALEANPEMKGKYLVLIPLESATMLFCVALVNDK